MPLVLGRRAAAFLAVATATVLLAAGGARRRLPPPPRGCRRRVRPGRHLRSGLSCPLARTPGGSGRENARKGSTAWRIKAAAVASDTQLAGYADRVSIRPGEPLHLYVTTTARSFTVRAFRLGWYGGARARLVSTSPVLRGTVQRARTIDARHTVDHPLAPVGDPGHARLAGGHLPAAAHRQPRAGQVHPRHGPVERGARAPGADERRDHLPGVQRLGRLLPRTAARQQRRHPRPRRQLRPAVRRQRRPHHHQLRAVPHRRGGAGRPAPGLPHRRRPRAQHARPGRCPRPGLARPRRVLVDRDAAAGHRGAGPRA